jgi:hypothetical protein
MKWFDKWFARKCKEAWESRGEDVPINKLSVRSARESFDSDEGLNMQVYKAIGGKIISFNRYNHKVDRHNRTVYIITDEQDFERELGKIITLESLKQ